MVIPDRRFALSGMTEQGCGQVAKENPLVRQGLQIPVAED